MTSSIEEQDPSVKAQARWIKPKSDFLLKKAHRAEPAPKPVAGNGKFVRQLVNLHRSVMLTAEHTKPATEPCSRLAIFAKAVSTAIELAETIKLPAAAGLATSTHVDDAICDLQDITNLARAALDAGREEQGFLVLEGLGFLLGGKPHADLERAMGLLWLKRPAQACDQLAKALEGLTDHDGMVSALLAQLRFDAKDTGWRPLAERVLATALNVEARTRCTELLAANPG